MPRRVAEPGEGLALHGAATEAANEIEGGEKKVARTGFYIPETPHPSPDPLPQPSCRVCNEHLIVLPTSWPSQQDTP